MSPSSMLSSLLVGAMTVSLAAGAAVPASSSTPGAEVAREANPNFKGRNGPMSLYKAYKKFNIEVPDTLMVAAMNKHRDNLSKREAGNTTTVPDANDAEFLTPVQIGTPAQTLKLDFDTGSSDLWVFSTETDAGQGRHNIYNPAKSTTSKKLAGATYSISYGDGSASAGDVFTDAVTVGGVKVAKQAVESAQQVTNDFATGDSDGLMGLAFSSINTVQPQKQKTFFANAQANLDQPLFTADLRHDAPGSYIFGSVPAAAKNINFAPVDNSQGFWKFQTSTALNGNKKFAAIADTGTTLLLMDDPIVNAYYAQVKGAQNDAQQGGFVFPCNADLPDFTFNVGQGKINVPGNLINFTAATGNTCFGGIQSSAGVGFAIFGDVALKSSFVVFDGGKTQVGWAQKV